MIIVHVLRIMWLLYLCTSENEHCTLQIKADHAAYYRNALRYLGCKDLNEIPCKSLLLVDVTVVCICSFHQFVCFEVCCCFLFRSICCCLYLRCIFVLFLVGEQIDRTFSLALAALLGEGVYNFGELVSGR